MCSFKIITFQITFPKPNQVGFVYQLTKQKHFTTLVKVQKCLQPSFILKQ